MLCDGFVVIIVLLVDKSDGNGGGGVEHFWICDAFVSVPEDNCSWCNYLGFSSTFRLRILTRAACEEVGAIGYVGDVLCKFVGCGSGEEIS